MRGPDKSDDRIWHHEIVTATTPGLAVKLFMRAVKAFNESEGVDQDISDTRLLLARVPAVGDRSQVHEWAIVDISDLRPEL